MAGHRQWPHAADRLKYSVVLWLSVALAFVVSALYWRVLNNGDDSLNDSRALRS